ncbi:MAG: hypothetical protein QG642_728 [Patescibacteria group bacterium]|nr:hypothetical protein [Patescibacteria group bacterium]
MARVNKVPDQILREIVENFPNNLDDDGLIAALNAAFTEREDYDRNIIFLEAAMSEHYPDTIVIQMVEGEDPGIHLIQMKNLRAMIKKS